jgi:hypothetical protein
MAGITGADNRFIRDFNYPVPKMQGEITAEESWSTHGCDKHTVLLAICWIERDQSLCASDI